MMIKIGLLGGWSSPPGWRPGPAYQERDRGSPGVSISAVARYGWWRCPLGAIAYGISRLWLSKCEDPNVCRKWRWQSNDCRLNKQNETKAKPGDKHYIILHLGLFQTGISASKLGLHTRIGHVGVAAHSRTMRYRMEWRMRSGSWQCRGSLSNKKSCRWSWGRGSCWWPK